MYNRKEEDLDKGYILDIFGVRYTEFAQISEEQRMLEELNIKVRQLIDENNRLK